MDKKRIIQVDGVNYSLDTGEQVATKKIGHPTLPTPSRATDERNQERDPVIATPVRSASRTAGLDIAKPSRVRREPLKLENKPPLQAKEESSKTNHQPQVKHHHRSGRIDHFEKTPDHAKESTEEVQDKLVDNLPTKSTSKTDSVSVRPPLKPLVEETKLTKKSKDDSVEVKDNGVSHPSLPMPTIQKPIRRPVQPAIHIFLHPFIQRIDLRMAIMSSVRALSSWRFWVVAVMPFIVYRLNLLSTLTPNQLLTSSKETLERLPYQLFLAGGLLLFILICLSYYLGSQGAQVMAGLKLKQIDHRLSSSRFFFDQSNAKLFRTLFARVTHLVIFWGSLVAIIAVIWYLSSSTQVYFETVKLPVVICIGLLGLTWLLLVGARWPMARGIVSATDKPFGYVFKRSFGLTFHHIGKTLGIALFWSSLSLLFLAIIGLIVWSMSTYLISDLELPVKITLSAVGFVLLAFLFCVYTTWSLVYWASAYRVLAAIGHHGDISEYLQIERPSGHGNRTLLALIGVILLIGTILGFIGYQYQDDFVLRAKQAASGLPESFDKIIPRIK